MKKVIFIWFLFSHIVSLTAQNGEINPGLLEGTIGTLPEGWNLTSHQTEYIPSFTLKEDSQGRYLSICGNGDSLAVVYISKTVSLAPGTYEYKVLFSMTEEVNPQRNLLFQCKTDSHDGIFKFYKLADNMVEGRETITIKGNKTQNAEIRIFYRLNPVGEVKIRSLSLTPTEEIKPRWVRFACTEGQMEEKQMIAVATQAEKDKADLLLFPEMVGQKEANATNGEKLMKLLSGLAKTHSMYIAASLLIVDPADNRTYNRGLLYDRTGNLAGTYDKIHPYSPEINEQGITPGKKTGIFETDFGKVGLIICYDSWFTDVTELFALKGAEVILFPVAGYYKSIIPARAADNNVRFIISVLGKPYGIYDTLGRNIQEPENDRTLHAAGNTYKDIHTFQIEGIDILCASLDLNCSPSPHYNGGKMSEAPGGKRNRAEQIIYLDDLIKKEKERWWEE